MAALQANPHSLRTPAIIRSRRSLPAAALPQTRFRCFASGKSSGRSYSVTLLPGDGISPEVVAVVKDVLTLAGSLEGISFQFKEMLIGGSALDEVAVPLPDETLETAKGSDAVLLGAIGGYKWDKNEKHLKPETGLLQIRAGFGVFANRRPAAVLPQV